MVKKSKYTIGQKTLHNFPIIGVGASAGGLEAFTGFLSKIPVNTGMAFILIQHLDPSQPSMLTELLAKITTIPVDEVKEDTMVAPDHVYVIPPGRDMIIHSNNLMLQRQPARPGVTHSIDVFFRSLGEEAKEQAAVIILSGTGSDGTEGAKVVKAEHGLVIVQDPETAKYDGMPKAAISAGLGDYVLQPEQMANKLVEYYQKSLPQREVIQNTIEKDGTGLKNILSIVRVSTGRDFSGYKASSITRRIQHRMAVNRFENNSDYLRYLKEQPSEINELMKDFLINVTSFFRDKEAFESLKNVIGDICNKKPETSPIRVWIPGCSTGEEAYSIAMLLMECAEESKHHHDIQVFGTDLDPDTITFARTGLYPASISRDVDAERLKRFFNQIDKSYQVKKDLREKIVFAVHDIVTDPPYSRMDIVSVRNLLIYFDNELQKRIIPLLHYALNEHGILFLGTAETVGEVPDYFTTIDSKWRIYRSIHNKKTLPRFHSDQLPIGKLQDNNISPVLPTFKVSNPVELLLEALPPSVIIDRNYQVTYIHGNTGSFLHLPEGNPSSSILEMANTEIKTGLATALHEMAQEQKETIREITRLKRDGGTQSVRITVRPLSKMDGSMIVTFADVPPSKRLKTKGTLLTKAKYLALQQELQLTKDTLHGTIGKLETTNEELRSANEEYMSTNEELKSANEELETSREELRSVNEELTTVNTEREEKIEELTTVSDDMRNLLNSTDIATIYLDQKLHIRRFTPAITSLFKIIKSDVGRPLADIATRLKADSLPQAAKRVLDTLIPIEQEVKNKDGHWYSMKIHPYRTTDNAIEGVVATFSDINNIKAALSYTQSIVDTIREPLLVLNEELKVISASRAFYTTFKVTKEVTEGEFIYKLGKGQWNIPQLREILKEVLQKGKVFEGFRIEHSFPGIGNRIMLLNARRVFDGVHATRAILLTLEDITNRLGPGSFTQKKEKRGKS